MNAPNTLTTIESRPFAGSGSCTVTASAICPDLLDLDKIGEADNLRGRVVRAFFRMMRLWPA